MPGAERRDTSDSDHAFVTAYPDDWASTHIHNYPTEQEDPVWLDDLVDEIDRLAARMTRHVDGYEIDGVAIVDDGHDGRFIQRENGEVEIELGKYHRLIEVAGEELGHDLFHDQVKQENSDLTTLEEATFNEMVANLCSRYFTDEIDSAYTVPYEPTVFDQENREAFQGAFDAINTDYREEEQERLAEMEALLEDDQPDWAAVTAVADELVDIPPESGLDRFSGVHDTGYRANLFVHNLQMETVERNKRSLRLLTGLLQAHQENGDRAEDAVLDVYDTCPISYVPRQIRREGDEVLHEDDYLAIRHEMIHNGPVGFVTPEDLREQQLTYNAETILERTVEATLAETQEALEDYIDAIEQRDSTELLLDAVADERYAKGYDFAMDFPHDVGGALAEDLYQAGTEPRDIVDDPATYRERCQSRLRSTIKDWRAVVDSSSV